MARAGIRSLRAARAFMSTLARRGPRETEERLRAQYEGNPLPTFTWQRKGRDFVLVDCNEAAQAFTRRQVGRLIGRTARGLYPDRPDIVADISRCFDERITVRLEMAYRLVSTGEVRQIAGTFAFVPPDLVLVYSEDITERNRAETALRESEELFRSVFQNAAIGMAVMTTWGRFARVNRALCDMLGYSEQELIGQTWESVTHPDDLRTGGDYRRRLLASEIETCQFEKRYIHRLGREVRGLLTISTTWNADGQPLHLIAQVQDITRTRQAEAALERAREEIEARAERQLRNRNPHHLTFRELTVLNLVAAGKSDKETATERGISPHTVHKHLSNILAKMEASSRTEAAARAVREGLLE